MISNSVSTGMRIKYKCAKFKRVLDATIFILEWEPPRIPHRMLTRLLNKKNNNNNRNKKFSEIMHQVMRRKTIHVIVECYVVYVSSLSFLWATHKVKAQAFLQKVFSGQSLFIFGNWTLKGKREQANRRTGKHQKNRIEQKGTEQNRTEQNRTEQNRTEQNKTK